MGYKFKIGLAETHSLIYKREFTINLIYKFKINSLINIEQRRIIGVS